jgi:superoxide dismutase, Cu-Zn family
MVIMMCNMSFQSRSLITAIAAAGLLVSAAACANSSRTQASPPSPASSASPSGPASAGNAHQVVVTATFAKDDAAVNYDKNLVPDGAKALVAEYVFDGDTTVTLNVRGLMPNRAYGAHAHTMACGPTGDAAGPHFQHNPDPVKPSVDPAFANSSNEIWLDFKTDAQGNATTATTVPWVFQNTKAGSVVIHAEPTQTAPGKAGMAGARAACMTVGF